MIERDIEEKFLNWLYEEYTRKFGYGVRNIDKCRFLTTYLPEDLPVEFSEVNSEGVTKSHVLTYAKELEAKGLLRFSKQGLEFYFTKEGFDKVSMSNYQRFLNFLNKNPSILSIVAILVSFGSLVIALIALVKK